MGELASPPLSITIHTTTPATSTGPGTAIPTQLLCSPDGTAAAVIDASHETTYFDHVTLIDLTAGKHPSCYADGGISKGANHFDRSGAGD